jgi:biopolymer transport protein ExbD
MRFTGRKRRSPPTVIIVSLIDVLIVVLIFMMVATTFKQHPSVRLALPESRQATNPGDSGETLVITVAKEPPYFYLGQLPVTYENLRTELKNGAARNAQLKVALRADDATPFGQIVRVMDAAKEAGVKLVNAQTRAPGQP